MQIMSNVEGVGTPLEEIPGTNPTITIPQQDNTQTIITGPECTRQGTLTTASKTPIWMASIPNMRPKEGFKGKNSDAATAIVFDNGVDLGKKTPQQILDNALLQTKNAVNACANSNSGSTGTAAWYDPRTTNLHISSIGDSPAFLVFYDKNKPQDSVYVEASVTRPVFKGAPRNFTSSLHKIGEESSGVVYTSPKKDSTSRLIESKIVTIEHGAVRLFENTPLDHDASTPEYIPSSEIKDLNITGIKQRVCEAHALDPDSTAVLLAVASDGIDYISRDKDYDGKNRTKFWDPPYEQCGMIRTPTQFPAIIGQKLHENNPAYAIIETAKKTVGNGHDDITLMLMPLEQKKDGQPIALFIADGIGQNGKNCSHAAAKAFTASIREQTQSHAADTIPNAAVNLDTAPQKSVPPRDAPKPFRPGPR